MEVTPFTHDSAKSKIDQFSQITNWVKFTSKQHHSKVLLNSFPMNGHTLLVFWPRNQNKTLYQSRFYSGSQRVKIHQYKSLFCFHPCISYVHKMLQLRHCYFSLLNCCILFCQFRANSKRLFLQCTCYVNTMMCIPKYLTPNSNKSLADNVS